MKKLTVTKLPQTGFIPMMLTIIGVIAGIIYFVYTRVIAGH
jgi:LPXTG-motif cell wall-anchored protein